MSHILPTWIDLYNTAFWVTAVFAVAVVLGGLWAVIDTIFSYGLPKFRKALDEPGTIRIAKPARPFSDRQIEQVARIASFKAPSSGPKGFAAQVDRQAHVLSMKARAK